VCFCLVRKHALERSGIQDRVHEEVEILDEKLEDAEAAAHRCLQV